MSSRALALVAAGVNLVICAAVVAALMAIRQKAPGNPYIVATEPPETVTEAVPSTTRNPPSGYQPVDGPGGMTTYIPASWPSKRSTGPGAMQANDPAGSSRFLRYGGAISVSDAYGEHVKYEQQFSANRTRYVLIRLERTVVRGMPAVDWECEYDASDGRRHDRSVYWLARGYEYFVYASSPVALWPHTQEILDVMLNNATP